MDILSTMPDAHPNIRQRLSTLSRDERQTLPPCDICQNDYGPEERPVKLPCNHIFGEKCIITWARGTTPSGRYNGCPTCRAEILPPTLSSRLTGFKYWHAAFCHQFVILAGGKIGLAMNVAVWTLNVFVRILPESPMRSFLRVLMFVLLHIRWWRLLVIWYGGRWMLPIFLALLAYDILGELSSW